MSKKKKILIGIVIVLILLGGGLYIFLNKAQINKNASLKDIKDGKKVNIYIFWGDGCSHCKKEFDFLNDISLTYGKYFNVYGFEVWFNKDNNLLKDKFAKQFNDKVKGVPYTIIGKETFNGFNGTKEEKKKIKKAIKKAYKDGYDIYFESK